MSRSIVYAIILSILLYQFFNYYLNLEDDEDPQLYPTGRSRTTTAVNVSEQINASKYALRSVIVLGFPLAGTADLARALNSFAQVYLVDDIVQKSDVGQYSDRRIISHLSSALRFPKDRISASNILGLSTTKRFFKEFFGSYKFSVRLKLVGFTLNPFHVSENALLNLVDNNPDAKIIVLKRHNLVKLAVASHLAKVARGGHAHARGHQHQQQHQYHQDHHRGDILVGHARPFSKNESNSSTFNATTYTAAPSSCSKEPHHTIPWNITSFLTEVIDSKRRYDAYLERIASMNRTFHVVYFEDMQIDLENVVEKLFDYVGCSELHWPEAVTNTATAGGGMPSESDSSTSASDVNTRRDSSKCVSAIDEDLSSVLVNFNSIRQGLLKRVKKAGKKRGAGQILTNLIPLSKSDVSISSSAIALQQNMPSSTGLYCILQQLEAREPNATYSSC